MSTAHRFHEGRYYRFGLALGVANLAHNRLRLGLKKSIGKILQPINSYTRFPEYEFVERNVRLRLSKLSSHPRPKVLDIGSPKCMGLYLARHFSADLQLTDIDEASVREAEILWNAIRSRARGSAEFSVQDARRLPYPDHAFDIVYSMSVIEHVGGDAGDSETMREAVRVLRPGGLLLVTVPMGEEYIEQDIIGFEGAARSTGDERSYFFQRIYTPATATERIINSSLSIELRDATTIRRSNGFVAKTYRKLGLNARGLVGFFNPILSRAINCAADGIVAAPSSYGKIHSANDLYGDLMLSWEKNGNHAAK